MWHGYGLKSFDVGKCLDERDSLSWLQGLHRDMANWLQSDDMKIARRFMAWREMSELVPAVFGPALVRQSVVCGLSAWTDRVLAPTMGDLEVHHGVVLTPMDWSETKWDKRRSLGKTMDCLMPKGKDGDGLCWAVLRSKSFKHDLLNFFQPMPLLLDREWPLAIAVDVEPFEGPTDGKTPESWGSDVWGSATVGTCGAPDCRVTVVVAVSGPTARELKRLVDIVRHDVGRWISLKRETNESLLKAAAYFGPTATAEMGMPDTGSLMTSHELALLLAPLGYPFGFPASGGLD